MSVELVWKTTLMNLREIFEINPNTIVALRVYMVWYRPPALEATVPLEPNLGWGQTCMVDYLWRRRRRVVSSLT